MSAFLVDANVLLDVATADATWMAWSQGQLAAAAGRGAIIINPIIYAELSPAFASAAELDRWLDPGVFGRAVLPYEAGWLAAQAFLKYRRAGPSSASLRLIPLITFFGRRPWSCATGSGAGRAGCAWGWWRR